MSFVVWPYINNVKVMISRLKALSCLVSPLPPSLHPSPLSVEKIVRQKREWLLAKEGESKKQRNSWLCCRNNAGTVLPHWLLEEKGKEAKNHSEKTSLLCLSPLPFLCFLSLVLQNDGWGTCTVASDVLSSSSRLPLSLSSSSSSSRHIHTHSDTLC